MALLVAEWGLVRSAESIIGWNWGDRGQMYRGQFERQQLRIALVSRSAADNGVTPTPVRSKLFSPARAGACPRWRCLTRQQQKLMVAMAAAAVVVGEAVPPQRGSVWKTSQQRRLVRTDIT